MNIIQFYLNGNSIEGIPYPELESVMNGSNTKIKIQKDFNGLLILNNGKQLKCIENYYTPSNNKKIKKKDCFYVQMAFNVGDVGVNNCRACHLRAATDERIKRK